MEQIKFRYWNEDIEEFEYISNAYDLYDWYWDEGEGPNDSISSFNWEQYIGLKDKNGIEGYKNDICKYKYLVQTSVDHDHSGKIFSGVGKIVFIDGCFMIRDIKTKYTVPLHYPDLSFEVIGNIYENPELLND